MAKTNETKEPKLTVQQVISKELVRENITEKVISEMESTFLVKTLSPYDPREKYIEIYEDHQKLKDFKSLIVTVCKAGREDAIKTQREWVAKEKELTARVGKIVDHIASLRAIYEEEKEKQKQEKKRIEEANWFNRSLALTKMGAELQGDKMVLEDAEVDILMLRQADADTWDNAILPLFTPIFEKREAVRLENERIEKEKREKEEEEKREFELQQQKLKEEQAEFARKQAAFEKQQKEAADAAAKEEADRKQKIIDDRMIFLFSIGLFFNEISQLYYFRNEFFETQIHRDVLINSTTEEWDDIVKGIGDQIKDAKKQADDKAEAQIKERERIAAENAIREQKEKEEERQRLAKIEEEERMAKATDSQKWVIFCEALNDIEVPEMKSKKYRTFRAMAKEKLEEIKSLK